MTPPVDPDEQARLAALYRYQILDTGPESVFDDAVALVRTICATPIALVSLVDADRQWFKAKAGTTIEQTARDTSVCSLAIRQRELFVIPDLSRDPRTKAMSLVAGEAAIRFYAGAPLITTDGMALGSLCAIDTVARPEGLTPEQEAALAAIARQVTATIEMRGAITVRDVALTEQRQRQERATADAAILGAMLNAQRAVLKAGGDFEASLRALVATALEAVPAADGVVVERHDGDSLVYYLAAGSSLVHLGQRIPLQGSLSGHALAEQATIFSADVAADPRADRALARALGLGSAIVVPLFRRGEAFGLLKIHAASPGVFHSRDVLVTQLFASLISATYHEDAALTALRSAEAAEQRYGHIINSAIDNAVIGLDAAGTVTSWSRGSERIFGWTEAEMIGASFATIFTSEDRARRQDRIELKQARATGLAPDERWHRRKDGSLFYAHGSVVPLDDGSGGFVKSLRNITQEHVTREALAESRERLDVALETGLIGFFDWDVTTDCVRGDARMASFYGLDEAAAARGLPRAEFAVNVHPADRDGIAAATAEAIASCRDYTRSFRVVTGASETRWLLARGRCIEQRDGRAARFVGTAVDVTTQHEAQEKLRVSRERLELATRAARLGSFDYAPQDDRLEWDDRCRALFGLPPGAPVSYEGAFLAGLHPDDRERAAAAVTAALDPAGSHTFDIEYRTIGLTDGIERAIAARGLAFFEGQTPVRLVGTVLDVTAARREREKLRETEERYRFAVRATADTIWDWDLVRDQVLWNEALSATYGHDLPGQLSDGAWWLDRIHPDDRDRVSTHIHDVIDSDATDWRDEYRFRRADGSYADVRDRGYVLRNAQGAARRMLGAMLDQTDRKQAERNLEREVEARTRERDQVWEATPDLLCVAGMDGRFVATNPAWAETLGWTDAELGARPFIDFIHPDDRAATTRAMEVLLDGRSVHGFENRYRAKDGGLRWFSWNAVPRDGLIYAVVRDVTDAHAQAEALARAEEQLRQSQKMEAVGQLTGGLAHDFNNLLAGISGSLEMMQVRMDQGRRGDVDRYLAAAQGATRRAAALTHRLLAFSRRQTLTPSSIDVNRLVVDMGDLVERTAGPEIAIEIRAAPDLWRTLVDPNQLENALLNLCINARDAMPGGGRLTIATANRTLAPADAAARDLAAGEYVTLCVADTGTGMTKEVIERAFDPFFTTKPIGQGTGLGLSMIYGFARQSGGHIVIESEVGEGTTVCVFLPRHTGGADEAAAARPPRAGDLAQAQRGETVLVVDDEPTVRMLVVDALEELGYAAIEAGDGPAGLRIIESNVRMDLLITDVGLPGGMNGRQLADAARAVRPDLKILFITGYAEHAVLNHGDLDHGMSVLTKPFAMETLAGRIRATLEAGMGPAAGETER